MSAPDQATLSLRRRAELRGLEALAQSRVNIGVWTARLLGSLGILNAVMGLGFGMGIPVALGWFVWGAGIHLSANRMARGIRLDAWILLGLFLLGDVAYFATGQGDVLAFLIAVATLAGLGVGAIGTTTLARIREEQLAAEPSRPAVPG